MRIKKKQKQKTTVKFFRTQELVKRSKHLYNRRNQELNVIVANSSTGDKQTCLLDGSSPAPLCDLVSAKCSFQLIAVKCSSITVIVQLATEVQAA